MSQKTEKPTPRRLRKARQAGDVPVSSALCSAGALVVALSLLPAGLELVMLEFRHQLLGAIDSSTAMSPSAFARAVLTLSVPLLLATTLTSAAIGFVQTGGVVTFRRLAPDPGRIISEGGLRHFFSGERIVRAGQALVGASLVLVISYTLIERHLSALAHSTGRIELAGYTGLRISWHLAWICAAVGVTMAGVDWLVTRNAWLSRLRMSRSEINDELRQAEGDPEVRSRRRSAHRELLSGPSLAQTTELANLEGKSLVLKDGQVLAVALYYDRAQEQAPRVVYRARGAHAGELLAVAEANDIPVVERGPLTRALFELPLGSEIPEEYFEPVAVIVRDTLVTSLA